MPSVFNNSNGQFDPDEREEAKAAMQKRREQGGGKGQGKGEAKPGQDPERRQKLLEKFEGPLLGQLA